MPYLCSYASPLGRIILAGSADALTGLCFEGQKHFPRHICSAEERRDTPVFRETARWLDAYFQGKAPCFSVPLDLSGTDFQLSVWQILRSIPYGKTITYGEIASRIAAQKGLVRMSARAVGSAVGRNPVSILVPCHRVIGAGGSLTGYAGGIDRKIHLLTLEGALTPSMVSR